jgi:hypothetical protein
MLWFETFHDLTPLPLLPYSDLDERDSYRNLRHSNYRFVPIILFGNILMAVAIQECPHCYTRVGFKEDGVCPACSKRLSDGGAEPTRTLLTVGRASSIAAICICCGEDTARRVAVSKGTRSRTKSVLAAIGTVLAVCLAPIFRGALFAVIHAEGRKKYPHQRVRVSIPLCSRCQGNHGVPKPHRVDFENATMSFVISREIAAMFSPGAEPASPRAALPHR